MEHQDTFSPAFTRIQQVEAKAAVFEALVVANWIEDLQNSNAERRLRTTVDKVLLNLLPQLNGMNHHPQQSVQSIRTKTVPGFPSCGRDFPVHASSDALTVVFFLSGSERSWGPLSRDHAAWSACSITADSSSGPARWAATRRPLTPG